MPLLRPRVKGSNQRSSGRVAVSTAGQDSLLAAIIKWIPIEVLTIFKTVDGFIPTERARLRLYVALFVMVITPLWIAYATKPPGQHIGWRQVILAPIAFSFWATAMLSEPLRHIFTSWDAWMGSIVLGFGTLLLPIADGILRSFGLPQD